jgi:hypothetical protein
MPTDASPLLPELLPDVLPELPPDVLPELLEPLPDVLPEPAPLVLPDAPPEPELPLELPPDVPPEPLPDELPLEPPPELLEALASPAPSGEEEVVPHATMPAAISADQRRGIERTDGCSKTPRATNARLYRASVFGQASVPVGRRGF